MAVNVIDAPAHVGLAPEVTAVLTEGVTPGVMDMVMPVLVALVWLAQADAGGTDKTQVTTSPFASVAEVKVGLLVPALTPFIFH